MAKITNMMIRENVISTLHNVEFEGFEYFGRTKDGLVFMNQEGKAFTVKPIVHTEKVDVYGLVQEFDLAEKARAEREAAKAKKVAKAQKVEKVEKEGE